MYVSLSLRARPVLRTGARGTDLPETKTKRVQEGTTLEISIARKQAKSKGKRGKLFCFHGPLDFDTKIVYTWCYQYVTRRVRTSDKRLHVTLSTTWDAHMAFCRAFLSFTHGFFRLGDCVHLVIYGEEGFVVKDARDLDTSMLPYPCLLWPFFTLFHLFVSTLLAI